MVRSRFLLWRNRGPCSDHTWLWICWLPCVVHFNFSFTFHSYGSLIILLDSVTAAAVLFGVMAGTLCNFATQLKFLFGYDDCLDVGCSYYYSEGD